MKVLGIGGSARRGGVTERILEAVLTDLKSLGHETRSIYVIGEDIRGCSACLFCEKYGRCVTPDDRTSEILIKEIPWADVVIVSSPIYFAGVPWKLKALIDRVQVVWAQHEILGKPREERGKSAVILAGGSSPEEYFKGPGITIRSALRELGYPAKWTGILKKSEAAGTDIEGFIEQARQEIRKLVE